MFFCHKAIIEIAVSARRMRVAGFDAMAVTMAPVVAQPTTDGRAKTTLGGQ